MNLLCSLSLLQILKLQIGRNHVFLVYTVSLLLTQIIQGSIHKWDSTICQMNELINELLSNLIFGLSQIKNLTLFSVQFTKSCLTLCDPMTLLYWGYILVE